MSQRDPASAVVASGGYQSGEQALERFDRAWSQGDRPRLEDYLPASDPERRAVLAKLVRVDLEHRLGRGEAVRVEDYLNRFPELATDRATVVLLLRTEYEQRREAESAPLEEYLSRFPEYAEDLHALSTGQPFQGTVSNLPPGPTLPRSVRPFVESDSAAQRIPVAAEDLLALATDWPTLPGYEILSQLGRGGMGVVFQARDLRLQRLVALKMIQETGQPGPEHATRFRREAEAVAHLQHPNIVQIFEVGEHEGRPFFALEFVEGGSLDRLLRGTPRAARPAAALAETLARAVHAAHQRGIIHRDLKPANVLLAFPTKPETSAASATDNDHDARLEEAIPKITDFGLAKRLDEDSGQTRSGAILGTPSYMAPEQAEGNLHAIGPATDVYALGAILYECLTGRPPFKAATVLDTLEQVRSQEVVPPSRLQAPLARDLETICLKCLQKNPVQRYASALDLAEDLHRFLAGEPIRARPVGALGRFGRWCKRKPVVAGLLIALVVVVVSGLITVTTFWRVAVHQTARAETKGQEAVHQAERAETEKGRARKNLDRALQAIDQMLNRIADERMAILPQFDEERRQILADALVLYKELLDENSTEARARFETGKAYWRMGDIHRLLGDKKQASEGYEHALALLVELDKNYPDTTEYQAALATCYRDVGKLVDRANPASVQQALEQAERARTLWQRLFERDPTSLEYCFWLADIHYWLAGLNDWLHRPTEAESHFRQTVELQKKLIASPAATPKQKRIASVYCSMGAFYLRSGEWDKAEETLRNGLRLFEKLAPEHPREVKFQSEWAFANSRLGKLAERKRNWIAAEAFYRAALPPLEGLLRDHPTVLSFAGDCWECRTALALALEAQSRYPDALAEFRRARELEDKVPPLPRRSEQMLRGCERRAKLDSKLPAILSGEAKPANVAEQVELAMLCQTRKELYATAARFYEQAFREKPDLADTRQGPHRYNAACAAALAGCGVGRVGNPSHAANAGPLGAEERRRWRKQALDWLRADLAFWTKHATSGEVDARPRVQQFMRRWQSDPDLAGLRDPAEVAGLPEQEPAAWRQFWAEVEALRQRSRGQK